ncbi:NADH-quinone oxidoreductase subunit L [Shewanella aestuarii]|uniref:Probable inorganic carbon transporter subunit DabB n=1 Tax=Shewanella aestuarii TaxID=1028752 RepID=A0A6G9QP10_9GAMM|nr:NADH-quinone oxidoreductase subunit L [Shewanella aestuarii]QIR15569.1 NADH-quinone oxidoreductase subunit L [Shewanella aestuarii]
MYPELSSILLLTIPIIFLFMSACSTAQQTGSGAWRLNLSYLIVLLFIGAMLCKFASPSLDTAAHYISQSNLSMVMLALVIFMSVILIAFSGNYMAGEPHHQRYWFWLFNTLAAVSFVVMSNHLILFWLGWVSISLALHKLLMFYPHRPRAVLAAHKKFLLARTAELSLLAAIGLLYLQQGTFFISEIVHHFTLVANDETAQLTTLDHIAAMLIALTALIKCAQLPIHGWLIQVVEAPTPVSALLHAGVINLGGFLLILFAPLFIQSAVAQWFVILVAGFTTVMAALIMTTRISVKVRLAWSTSAQMGLMLLECALGLFELALLHLLAHSVYKAYAFLHSGNAVFEDIHARLAPAALPKFTDWLLAAGFCTTLVSMALWVMDYQGVLSVWILLILALTMLVAQRLSQQPCSRVMPVLLLTISLVVSYSLFKGIFSMLLPQLPALKAAPFSLVDIAATVLFFSLFTINLILLYQPHKPIVQRLYIALFAGLYLDEWLTRLTLKLWPIRLPPQRNSKVLRLTPISQVEE